MGGSFTSSITVNGTLELCRASNPGRCVEVTTSYYCMMQKLEDEYFGQTVHTENWWMIFGKCPKLLMPLKR